MPVYCIQAGENGPVKIGYTDGHPADRLGTLQTGCWLTLRMLRVWRGDTPEERQMHLRFAASRLRGDWFGFNREMLGDVGLERLQHLERLDTRSQARTIIRLFGGDGELARVVGTSVAQVSRWRRNGMPADLIARLRNLATQLEVHGADEIDWDAAA